jgi:hypothetical protein
VKWLWGPDDLRAQLKVGDELNEQAVAHALETNILGFLQGATWPVRLLARGQIETFFYGEILLVETAIVPLMLLERDPRTFHRNMFVRAKMLNQHEHRRYAALIDQIKAAVDANNRAAMRDVHIEIFREICHLARPAFARYHLEFPPRVEAEMVAFYQREWPVSGYP